MDDEEVDELLLLNKKKKGIIFFNFLKNCGLLFPLCGKVRWSVRNFLASKLQLSIKKKKVKNKINSQLIYQLR